MRVSTSVGPPAANGTITRGLRDGQAWACAPNAKGVASAAPSRARREYRKSRIGCSGRFIARSLNTGPSAARRKTFARGLGGTAFQHKADQRPGALPAQSPLSIAPEFLRGLFLRH